MTQFSLSGWIQEPNFDRLYQAYSAEQKPTAASLENVLAFIRDHAKLEKATLDGAALARLQLVTDELWRLKSQEMSLGAYLKSLFLFRSPKEALHTTQTALQSIAREKLFSLPQKIEGKELAKYAALLSRYFDRLSVSEKNGLLDQAVGKSNLIQALLEVKLPNNDIINSFSLLVRHAYNEGKLYSLLQVESLPTWARLCMKEVIKEELGKSAKRGLFFIPLFAMLTVPPRGSYTPGRKIYDEVDGLIAESLLKVAKTIWEPVLIEKEELQALLEASDKKVQISRQTVQRRRPYLDANRLLRGRVRDTSIESIHREWYLNQALLLQAMRQKGVTSEAKKALALVMLHGYSKAATIGSATARLQGIQTSPFLPQYRYHRSTENVLLDQVSARFAQSLGMEEDEIELVDSPLFRDVLQRSKNDQKLVDVSASIDPIKPLRAQFEALQLPGEQPFAIISHKGQTVLVLPKTADPHIRHKKLMRIIQIAIADNGFRLSPDIAKEAWLRLEDANSIIDSLGLARAELATKGPKVGQVCKSFAHFLEQPVVKKFKALSEAANAPPYLKILPEATWRLLEGLRDRNVDEAYTREGLDELLQISYYRMLQAMNMAILRKDNLTAILNQIELLHQELQMAIAILSIRTPYAEGALQEAVRASHPEALVHLKASAMHCLSSVLSSIEALKQTNRLNVARMSELYYEETGILNSAKTYSLYSVEGDLSKQAPPREPIDLFVCEFHHNISIARQVYRPEDIAQQIKIMHAKKMLADSCTVAIDTTIDLEASDEVRRLIDDPEIKQLIADGKLNIVLFRSAQKFDMLGMDNYYGGICLTINNPHAFAKFNERMSLPGDQLKGLSYQGITHLQKYAGPCLDHYRQALMDNTQRLYSLLPKEALYSHATTNPMQISRIEDKRLVFIDIKFPRYPKLGGQFMAALQQFARREGLPLTQRPSFGFVTTNLISIGNAKIRLNPGLDSFDSLKRYAAFFEAVQRLIEQVMQEAKGLTAQQLDQKLAEALSSRLFK